MRRGANRVASPQRLTAFFAAALASALWALPCAGADDHGAGGDGELFTLPSVYVSEFRFEGNTAIPDERLAEAAAPYTGREVSAEELEALRQALTVLYVRAGHVTSGVVIPPQKVAGGVVTMKVVEGALEEVEIVGLGRIRRDLFRKRLERAGRAPVDVGAIQESLVLLEQDESVRRIRAELSPGVAQGRSRLRVEVEEKSPWILEASVSNRQSPSIGSTRLEARAGSRNLLGLGDSLVGTVGHSSGNTDYSLVYSATVNSHDTAIDAYYRQGDSVIVEEPFEAIDIQSKADTVGFGIRQPLVKTPSRHVGIGAAIEKRRSRTYLLDCPFSFTDVEDNESRVTVLRLSQEWFERDERHVLALRSLLSFGIDMFSPTYTEGGMDNKFIAWLGQWQLVRRLPWTESRLRTRAVVQLANDRLLPMERFGVGGRETVRGYRENALVRDNGAVVSAEVQVPLFRNGRGDAVFSLVPFVDAGWSWNSKEDTPAPSSLWSAGAGFEWAIAGGLNVELFYGHAFREMEAPEYDLQDDGIHFMVEWDLLRLNPLRLFFNSDNDVQKVSPEAVAPQ